MADEFLESELKIPVNDLDRVRSSLQRARAIVVQVMAREVNLLLDTADRRLGRDGSVLRLREYGGRAILTFKGRERYEGAIKVRPEHETEVVDSDRMGAILQQLGFSVRMRYEKDREEWRLENVSVVLDHTPMGDFVEIEGPRDQLEETADLLGLNTASAVRGSYVALWHEYRTQHPSLDLPVDMVFAR